MGMLDGLIGGAEGATIATLVNTMIEKHGGVQGIVAQFEKQGMGGTVQSWIQEGENQPITADEIKKVLGSDTVKNLASKVGMSPDDVASKLSAVLPTAIDKMTPQGKVAA